MLSFFIITSCGSNSENEKQNVSKKDTIATDESDMIEIEEVEMTSVYEATNTKTGKTKTMTQEEYLSSAIWENPDYVIKEIPVVK